MPHVTRYIFVCQRTHQTPLDSPHVKMGKFITFSLIVLKINFWGKRRGTKNSMIERGDGELTVGLIFWI